MTDIKDELVKNNKKINWIPEHIKEGRFGEWLANVKDWAISRERYWGTPIPIWECEKCAHIEVVGSVAELAEKSGEAVTLESDLHRPAIDKYQLTCPKCQGQMKRVKEVFDCWFDSGSMPFAQHHYPFENKELIDKEEQFPADFISEAIDQTRGWFYVLLAVSTILGKGAPYKNVICLGHINDKDGKKMSKSKGNVINPWDVISQYGSDAVRQHMYTLNQPGEGKRYNLDDVKEVFRQNIMLLTNVYKFYELYAEKSTGEIKRPESDNILDKWMMIKLDGLIEKVTGELNKFHIYESAREIPLFIDELSTWYLRRSRDRFKSENEDDKKNALDSIKYILQEFSKIIAPFMPLLAENLWQKILGYNFSDDDESVHLQEWPKGEKVGKKQNEILADMVLVRRVVELGLAKRDEAGIKIRQMLAKVTIFSENEIGAEYNFLIVDELNVQTLEWKKITGETKVELDTNITPELKKEGIKRELIRSINMLRKDAGLDISAKVAVNIKTDSQDVKEVVDSSRDIILKDTSSSDIVWNGEGEMKKEIKVDGVVVVISL
jgi:isoleucyl-tRNA synthetase